MAEVFRVVLDGVELTDQQRGQIDAAIQRAVVAHLAELDGGDDSVVLAAKLRHVVGTPGFVAILEDMRSFRQNAGVMADRLTAAAGEGREL
jgi:hypothetical protein